VGELCKRKVQGSLQSEYNYGYDDNKGNYKVSVHDHIGYRYEI
jgi:dual specificity tyrosine-phosphorylation-regulated kinase 2/3/4